MKPTQFCSTDGDSACLLSGIVIATLLYHYTIVAKLQTLKTGLIDHYESRSGATRPTILIATPTSVPNPLFTRTYPKSWLGLKSFNNNEELMDGVNPD